MRVEGVIFGVLIGAFTGAVLFILLAWVFGNGPAGLDAFQFYGGPVVLGVLLGGLVGAFVGGYAGGPEGPTERR